MHSRPFRVVSVFEPNWKMKGMVLSFSEYTAAVCAAGGMAEGFDQAYSPDTLWELAGFWGVV